MTGKIISAAELLTCEKLTEILKQQGVLREAAVTGIKHQSIGSGMLGENVRFMISYDREEENAPRTLAGKFPAMDPEVRKNSSELAVYMTEVRFYQEIASTVAIRTPHCFYKEIDPVTSDFGIIMEDLGPARHEDDTGSCSLEDAYLAMEQAAALHGPRWNDPALMHMEWTKARMAVIPLVLASLPQMLKTFEERYADMLGPEYMRICERFVDNADQFIMTEMSQTTKMTRWTTIHGDYRLDNMLFSAKDGKVPLAVVDWQTFSIDSGAKDVSYFLSTCMSIDERRARQDDLMDAYFENLKRHGVKDYSAEELRHDCRSIAYHGLITAIISATIAKYNEHSVALYGKMGRNACALMMDLDTLGTLG